MKVKLIGGSSDGEIVEVEHFQRHVKVQKQEEYGCEDFTPGEILFSPILPFEIYRIDEKNKVANFCEVVS